MIPNDDKTRFFKFQEFRTNLVKKAEDDAKKEKEQDDSSKKAGETNIIPADIKNIIDVVQNGTTAPSTGNDDSAESKVSDKDDAGNFKIQKFNDNDIWDTRVEIREFIEEALKEAGFEFDDSIVDQLFVAVIQAMVDKKLDIKTDMDSLSELIDINLANPSIEQVTLIQELINMLLVQSNESSQLTNRDVKKFVLEAYQKINKPVNPDSSTPITPNPDTPVEPNPNTPGDPDPINPEEPIVIDTPEKAMQALSNLIDETSVNGNISIKDFLLQFKAEASRYIQFQFGYDEQFADIIVMFLATAVSETSGVDSGLMKDVSKSAIKDRFMSFIQDMSFVDTSESVMVHSKQSGKEGNIEYLRALPSEDGYVAVGRGSENIYIHGNDDMTYSADGIPNNGRFLKFLTDYLKYDIYEGRLNDSQLALVMEKVIREFGGKYATKYKDTDTYNVPLYNLRGWLDKNNNNTFFDEFLNAILKVAQTIQNIDTDNPTSIDFDELFGSGNSLSAAQIHSNENSYFISNDPGIRAVMSALVNASDKYNITNDVDYLDFLNVFIKMIYQKCGEEVVTDNKGNPLLTKDILQKYLQNHSVLELKEFAESIELRNAYYMANFIQTGGINEQVDDFNQGKSGDCWLLSCLGALKQSETGRQIIDDAITVNADGTFTVTFHGGYERTQRWNEKEQCYYYTYKKVAKDSSYTFTLDDLFEARATGNYSKLDWDVLLLEMAVSKLKEEQRYDGVAPNNDGDPFIYGGYETEMMGYLTGNFTKYTDKVIYKNNAAERIAEIKDWFMQAFANGTIEEGTVGNYMMYINYGGHAYFITGVTSQGIYYADPYHPEKTKFVSWTNLAQCKDCDGKVRDNINIGYVDLSNL